jgi:hypothetical protein
MIIALLIILLIVIAVYAFLQQPQVRKKASGEYLKRIQNSLNYKNGQFQNVNFTPQLTGDASMLKVMREFFFNKDKRNVPSKVLPSKKTDLFRLSSNDDVLVWFGHSSYFLQLNEKKFLIDPVLSGHASPATFTPGVLKE